MHTYVNINLGQQFQNSNFQKLVALGVQSETPYKAANIQAGGDLQF